ncbi:MULTISPECIES: YtxH domain-containing protein [unclassified Streptococcus]|uniref:YtxH domain-containing protein n=1 Tax=unclassified Streptococcus TaxID=2608887 RepID=UPI00359DE1A6
MGKLSRKIGLGLVLGAAAGHYLSTEKGQQLVMKIKKGLSAYREQPNYYQEQAKAFVSEQVAYVKELVKEEFGEPSDAEIPSSDAEDIIITYTDEDL